MNYNQEELKHYGVLGMKWGTHLSKEVRGVKKAYKKKTEEQLKQYQEKWGSIPSPEHVTKEHVNYLKDTFKQQRTVKGRIRQVLNEGSKLIRKRK